MSQLAFDQQYINLSLLSDYSSYIDYCLELAASRLTHYNSISDLEKHQASINEYENLHSLEKPQNLIYLDKNTLNNGDNIKAWKSILEGRVFAEHFAAGEATRLNLGTKYLINMQKDLSFSKIASIISREKGTGVLETDIRKQTHCTPSDLLPLSLGVRHMLQYSYDIFSLSKTLGYDPKDVLSKQKMLLILNKASADIIIEEFINHRFYGFKPSNVLFMIQTAYHGINKENNEVFYDYSSPKRLHNHGQAIIQQTMTNEIFYIDDHSNKNYLSSWQFGEILKEMEIKISYNIEDLEYLSSSIDHECLALALKKNNEGCNMIMEVLPNNPLTPQKGGMAAFDPVLGRDVMIESFQLNGIENNQIEFLNKNVNYYPNPYIAWEMVEKNGMKMHVVIKDGFLYFQPVIGDVNFLVKTAIFTRTEKTPIKAWKSAVTTPLAINCMHIQDNQNGFKEYAEIFVA